MVRSIVDPAPKTIAPQLVVVTVAVFKLKPMALTEPPAPKNAMSPLVGVPALFVQFPTVSHALPPPLPGPVPLPLQPNVAARAAPGSLASSHAASTQPSVLNSVRDGRNR